MSSVELARNDTATLERIASSPEMDVRTAKRAAALLRYTSDSRPDYHRVADHDVFGKPRPKVVRLKRTTSSGNVTPEFDRLNTIKNILKDSLKRRGARSAKQLSRAFRLADVGT